MQRFYKITSYLVFSLNALLIFFWIFQNQLIIPLWLQPIGRIHPMLLHLPIGFFMMTFLLLIIRKQFRKKSFKQIYQLGLSITSITTVLAALFGFILSREGGYATSTLNWHSNAGVIFSLLCSIVFRLSINRDTYTYHLGMNSIGFILLLLTGHNGATLTHGENFISQPLMVKNTDIENDSITVFSKAILPVFEKKCVTCHNPKKKKGGLILTDKENILKGGENGVVIVAGNPVESEMIKRLYLEVEHEDHMPPSGKPQLTKKEILLLEQWIKRGADFKAFWNSLNDSDSLKVLAQQVMPSQKNTAATYSFDFVSPEKIKELNTPFRAVNQISLNSPAISAKFFMASNFKIEDLKSLNEVKQQLVELNLSGMPIGDSEIKTILEFKNLEILNLNSTHITDKSITTLAELSSLKQLSLSGTQLTSNGLKDLSNHKALQRVYCWNTSVTQNDVNSLSSKAGNIKFDIGYVAEENEKLKLTSPILINENFLLSNTEAVILKHNLPGVEVRYTIDGTLPDSVNGQIFTAPIVLNKHTQIKTIAIKDGWTKSSVNEYLFFFKGFTPMQSTLLSKPNKDYKANGSASLVDGQLGEYENFRDGTWLGFRENNFEATFKLDNPIKEITIISCQNVGSYLMPPKEVEIWGNENNGFKLLKKVSPTQPIKYNSNNYHSTTISLNGSWTEIKIIAKPVSKLPAWHSGKGEKGWLMVGEIIFN